MRKLNLSIGAVWLAVGFTAPGFISASAQVPVITAQPQSQSKVLGYPATLSVSATPASPTLSYQWRKDTFPIPAATGTNLTFTSVKYTDAGKYSVVVSNLNGTTLSSNATLTVTPPAPGELDFSFDPGSGADWNVDSVAVQPDGKVLIGGGFAEVNGVTRWSIARLNADGSLDPNFLNGLTGVDGGGYEVFSVALQPDGKVLIGGDFTEVNNMTRNNIARLNADGSLDTTFQNGLTGTDYLVKSVALQADGKVLIGGEFTEVNGVPRNYIARLNADGSLDTTFQNGLTGTDYPVKSVAVQPDGKVLIGGGFQIVNDIDRWGIARLNTDGSLDTNFLNGVSGVYGTVWSVAVQPDGKVVIGGDFYEVNDVARNNIARLNADGSLDTSFYNNELQAGLFNAVISAAVQADGKVLIGGLFRLIGGGLNRNGIARLNADGSLDTPFQEGMNGVNNSFAGVSAVVVQADGRVLIGASVPTDGGGNPVGTVNGVSRNGIARLYGAEEIYDATDADGDGLPNVFEREYGLNPEIPNRQMGAGASGPLNVTSDYYTDDVWARVLGSNPAGLATLNVSTTNGFARNDLVLMITMQDPNIVPGQNKAGNYEFGRIAALTGSAFTLTMPRTKAFSVTSAEKIQVLKVPEYTDVTVTSGKLTCQPWNGTNGGVLAFLAHSVTLGSSGGISADGKGYRGGLGVPSVANWQAGITGEGTTGYITARATNSLERSWGGGGAGKGADGSGGGGGYGSSGVNGASTDINGSDYGRGATSFGFNLIPRLQPGGGGGGSGSHAGGRVGVAGGAGGGIVFIAAGSMDGSGAISSRGAAGQAGVPNADINSGAGGGGGAGGSVYVLGNLASSVQIQATGGVGGPRAPSSTLGSDGGNGGVGRIRLDMPAGGSLSANLSPAPGGRTQLSAGNLVTSLFWGPYFDSDTNGQDDLQQFNLWALEDSDGDNVANLIESQRGTDPDNLDTDGDGLTDYQELFVYHTDPLKADTDGDGTSDAVEVAAGHDPRSGDQLTAGQGYQYDALDRLVGVDYPNGLSLLYNYDGNDNLLRQAYLSRDTSANGLFSDRNGWIADTNNPFADTDGDGYSDSQEWWAGCDAGKASSVPEDPLGPVGTNITAGIVFPFVPDNCVVAVGQLDGIGAEEIVVSADGNPGIKINFLVILSQSAAGWSTQKMNIGPFGVTSLAVGQPENRPSTAIYVGLRQPGGTGRVLEFASIGGSWISNTIATSTSDAAFVLGVRPGKDVLASFAAPGRPEGSPFYLQFITNTWTAVLANTNLSTQGLGSITSLGLHGVSPRGVRALDSGAIQVIGHDVNVPTNAIWNGDYSRWFFRTTSSYDWVSGQNFARTNYGGNLATVKDATLDTWLWNQFSSGGSQSFLIGLSRSSSTAPWQWASGAPFTYANWNNSLDTTLYAYMWSAAGGKWDDANPYYPAVIEVGAVERLSVSAAGPYASQRLISKGLSLTTGNLRLTNAVSVLYTSVDDQNLDGVMDANDEFVVAEYLFDNTNLTLLGTQRYPMSGASLAQSYGLTSLDVLYGNQQVLFTAEPDGRIFSWSATNSTTSPQRQLFSAHDQGKAWHALAAVRTLEPAQSLLGLRVDPAAPSRCDVVLWPPLRELSAAPDYPQTAPLTQILPAPNAGTNLAMVDIRLWDAEANPATVTLQYQLPLNSAWSKATIYPDQSVSTHPMGRTHRIYWDAFKDLGAGFTNTVTLRSQAQDVTLVGGWSVAVAYQVRTFVGNNPQAINDTAFTYMNQAVDIPVLANDTVLNGAPKFVASVELPHYGAVATNANQTVHYTPPAGFVGTDGFGYLMTDGVGGMSWAWVTVTVTDAPLAPIVIESPVMQAGNQFSMMISGPPGQVYQVQVSTNLTDWSAVGTLTNMTGTVPFIEQPVTNASRFYRAKLLP